MIICLWVYWHFLYTLSGLCDFKHLLIIKEVGGVKYKMRASVLRLWNTFVTSSDWSFFCKKVEGTK